MVQFDKHIRLYLQQILENIGGVYLNKECVRHPNNLRVLRKKKEVSIAQLARHAKVTEGFVAMIERGERKPSMDVAFKFAEILDLPLETIFS